jgi:hypothetical protein
MIFNSIFYNISVICGGHLLVEEIEVPGENHRPAASHWQTLSHNIVHLALSAIRFNIIIGIYSSTLIMLNSIAQYIKY